MAGDWIPWIKGLTTRREVIAIAAAVGRDRRWVSSVMMEAWSWADSESTDGFIPAVTEPADLTLIIPDTSAEFWSAVASVGWLRFRNGGVEFPNFSRYMGDTAKKRLTEAARKREYRRRPRDDVPMSQNCPKNHGTNVPKKMGQKRDTCTVLSSSVLSSCEKEEKQKTVEKEDFLQKVPLSVEGAAQLFAWEYRGGVVSQRNEVQIAQEFREWVASGFCDLDAIFAAISQKRDRSETFWQLKKRIQQAKKPANGQKSFADRLEEERAKRGKA